MLESLQRDPKLRRCRLEFQQGNIQQAAAHLGASREPDLVLVESDKAGTELDAELEILSSNCSPETKVMLFGANNDISLYKKLIGMGITDYFAPGSNADQVVTAIEQTFLEVDASNLARVIAFMDANGGAGSSVIAANIAHCLAEQYKQPVTLVDLDLTFGTVGLEFDIQAKQSVSDALAQPERLDETLLERFMVSYSENLSILPSVGSFGGSNDVDETALESLMTLLQQMNSYVVLDLPRAWSPWIQEVLLDCEEAVVVATPQLSGLRNAKSLLEHLSELRPVNRPTRLVLNKEGAYKRTELRSKDFEKTIGNKLLASIPHDATLFGTAENNGKLVVDSKKNHKISKQLFTLAQRLSGQ